MSQVTNLSALQVPNSLKHTNSSIFTSLHSDPMKLLRKDLQNARDRKVALDLKVVGLSGSILTSLCACV